MIKDVLVIANFYQIFTGFQTVGCLVLGVGHVTKYIGRVPCRWLHRIPTVGCLVLGVGHVTISMDGYLHLFRRGLGQMKGNGRKLDGRTPEDRAPNDAEAVEHHLAAAQQGVHPKVESCQSARARDHERVGPQAMGLSDASRPALTEDTMRKHHLGAPRAQSAGLGGRPPSKGSRYTNHDGVLLRRT